MKLHFTSRYHPEGDGQTERTNQTLEKYLRVYCNYQQDNWSELLPLAEFTYNNTPSATTGITPFFSNKGYHPNLTVHPKCNLASARAHNFVTDLNELHQQLRQHIAEAQHPLIPNDYWPRNSKLEAKYLSRLNISVRLGLQRNFRASSLARTKSLHTLAPTQSPCDSRTTSEQYTRYSTSQCWNQHFRIQYRIGFNLHPHLSLSKTNPNSKSQKSLIPRLTTNIAASFNILSDGQAMKALTKKPLGSMPLSSGMPPNLLQISTWPIHPNQARTQIFEVQVTSLLPNFHT